MPHCNPLVQHRPVNVNPLKLPVYSNEADIRLPRYEKDPFRVIKRFSIFGLILFCLILNKSRSERSLVRVELSKEWEPERGKFVVLDYIT